MKYKNGIHFHILGSADILEVLQQQVFAKEHHTRLARPNVQAILRASEAYRLHVAFTCCSVKLAWSARSSSPSCFVYNLSLWPTSCAQHSPSHTIHLLLRQRWRGLQGAGALDHLWRVEAVQEDHEGAAVFAVSYLSRIGMSGSTCGCPHFVCMFRLIPTCISSIDIGTFAINHLLQVKMTSKRMSGAHIFACKQGLSLHINTWNLYLCLCHQSCIIHIHDSKQTASVCSLMSTRSIIRNSLSKSDVIFGLKHKQNSIHIVKPSIP
eukprot:1161469-Pelagomonas_calceolata.AAC.8